MNAYEELKAIPQWVGWQTEERDGKPTKIPKNPHTGKNAQSNNPKTWADVNTAWRAVKRYGWDGLGFVFTIKAGIVGVDLDDCFEDDGETLEDWAAQVVNMLDSFTEYSPSGNGLHILCKGEIPASINQSEVGIEMYNELRYFTVTGDIYLDKPLAERTDYLKALYAVYGDPPREKRKKATNYTPTDVDEKEIAAALEYVPKQMDYYDWLRVLMAVHDVFPGHRGISLCESWSPGYEGEIEYKFRSFDRTAKSGVTIATLFHLAKKNGWQGKRRRRRPRMNHKQKMQALAAA